MLSCSHKNPATFVFEYDDYVQYVVHRFRNDTSRHARDSNARHACVCQIVG